MANKIIVDKNVVNEWKSLYKNGIHATSIAERYGYSVDFVMKTLTKCGLDMWRCSSYDTKSVWPIVKSYYLSGMSTYQIEDTLGIAHSTIQYWLEKHDVPRRQQSTWAKHEYNIDSHYFDNIQQPNQAYFLGLLYADGNAHPSHNEIRLTLQEKDADIIKVFRRELKTNRPIYHVQKVHTTTIAGKQSTVQDQVALDIIDDNIVCQLYKYGVVPNKTYLIEYPDFLDSDMNRHFIRGVMDGDGYIASRRGCVGICGTQSLCKGIANIVLNMLGVRCSVISCGSIYKCMIYGGEQCSRFLNWIYRDCGDICLQRKYKLYETLYKNYIDRRHKSCVA